MDKHKRHIFAALVMVLLIVTALTAWLTSDFGTGDDAAEVSPSPSTAPVSSDAPTDATPSPSISPTPVVTPSPTPSNEPVRQGTILSGSFDSDTGCKLNTHTEWAVTVASNGDLVMEVRVYVRSYTIGIGQRNGTVVINGTSYSFTSSPISVESNDSITSTLIYSTSYVLPVESGEMIAVPISVTWNYNGVYSGNDISSIHSETSVTVQG